MRLLQTLARKLEHMENPSRLNADRLAEMKSDLDFKQMQMGNSASSVGAAGGARAARASSRKSTRSTRRSCVELRQLAERMVRARAPRPLLPRGAAACARARRPRRADRRAPPGRRRRCQRARHLPGPQEPEGDLAAAARASAAKQQAIGRSGGLTRGGAARESEARRAQQPAHSRRPRRRARRARAGARARHRPKRRARARRSVPSCAFEPAALPPRRCGRTKSASSRRPTFITARSLETKYQPVADDCARALCALGTRRRVRGLAQQPLMASDGASCYRRPCLVYAVRAVVKAKLSLSLNSSCGGSGAHSECHRRQPLPRPAPQSSSLGSVGRTSKSGAHVRAVRSRREGLWLK